MTVYVDDMRARVGRLVLSHMVADSDAELCRMADAIGVARRWHQGDHFDVCQAKRRAAIRLGAVALSRRTLARMVAVRRRTGVLPAPADVDRRGAEACAQPENLPPNCHPAHYNHLI